MLEMLRKPFLLILSIVAFEFFEGKFLGRSSGLAPFSSFHLLDL
jgi:hypothetical protein